MILNKSKILIFLIGLILGFLSSFLKNDSKDLEICGSGGVIVENNKVIYRWKEFKINENFTKF